MRTTRQTRTAALLAGVLAVMLAATQITQAQDDPGQGRGRGRNKEMKEKRGQGRGLGREGNPGKGRPGIPSAQELMERFDKNGDGVIDRKEIEDHRPIFDRLDGNKDGTVDRAELDLARENEPDLPLPPLDEILKRWDKDGDGVIAREELENPRTKIFDRVDANQDGLVDMGELEAAGDALREKIAQGKVLPEPEVMMKNQDKNGDGVITEDEFQGPPGMFKQADGDGDGKVTLEELTEARNRFNDRIRQRAGQAGIPPMVVALFKKLDANGDGEVTPEEMPPAEEMFKFLDRNGDGVISRADADGALPPPPDEANRDIEAEEENAAGRGDAQRRVGKVNRAGKGNRGDRAGKRAGRPPMPDEE